MISNEAEARRYCAGLIDDLAMERLDRFCKLLAEENARQNLVSSSSLAHIWRRHIADSVQLLAFVPRETSPWLDLGTGAGFPGIVIAMGRPEIAVYLVEARKRRAEWLSNIASEFGLTRCTVLPQRLEDVATMSAGAISARAFAPLDRLLRLSSRFSTPNTVWLLPRGRSARQDLAAQSDSVQSMFHVEPSLTDPQAGLLVGRGRPALS